MQCINVVVTRSEGMKIEDQALNLLKLQVLIDILIKRNN